MKGGNVVNIAIELNGQPPLQVYVKPCREYKIILRSIDLGAMEVVTTYGEVRGFMQVGSPFSIPKAALVLAGFQPGFSTESYVSLEEQLKAFWFRNGNYSAFCDSCGLRSGYKFYSCIDCAGYNL